MFWQRIIDSLSGSSPRVRGTVTDQIYGLVLARFIPAGAGNSLLQCRQRLLPSVHPRGCGEQRKK